MGGVNNDNSPSQTTDRGWLFCKDYGVPAHIAKEFYKTTQSYETAGKWLVFLPEGKIDKFWQDATKAIKNKCLWVSGAKVSTKKTYNGIEYVACFYIGNADIQSYVFTVREQLKTLGVTWEIPFKTEAATIKKLYWTKGDKNISKYYC